MSFRSEATWSPAWSTGPHAWSRAVFIGGWTPAGGGGAPVTAPATGEHLGHVGLATPEDVDRAAATARTGRADWVAVGGPARADLLRAVADRLRDHADELMSWLVREAGATWAKAGREIAAARRELHHAAALAETVRDGVVASTDPDRRQVVRRCPVGTVGVITPFNAPVVLAMRAIAPALAVGNAVILKPDPRTSVCGGALLADLFVGAGVPPAMVHVLPGYAEVGQRLAEHPEIEAVLFTGSTAAGRAVGREAGAALKRVGLELGGNNPSLVLSDADPVHAADFAARSSFLHQGQICMSAGRHIVHGQHAEAFLDALVERAAGMRVGDPWADPDSEIGPMIDVAAARRVAGMVDASVAAGSTLRTGGRRDGAFLAPTVLASQGSGDPAWDEELFGPVAPVLAVDSDDEAVRVAADSPYGLVAAVHTRDVARALELSDALGCGTLRINDVTNHDEPQTPMAGWGSSGNGVGFGGRETLEVITAPRLVTWRPSRDDDLG